LTEYNRWVLAINQGKVESNSITIYTVAFVQVKRNMT